MTANSFKERYRNYTKSFADKKYSNETKISRYVWELKTKNRTFDSTWKAGPSWKETPLTRVEKKDVIFVWKRSFAAWKLVKKLYWTKDPRLFPTQEVVPTQEQNFYFKDKLREEKAMSHTAPKFMIKLRSFGLAAHLINYIWSAEEEQIYIELKYIQVCRVKKNKFIFSEEEQVYI